MASSPRRPHRATSHEPQRQSAFSRNLDKGFAAIQRGDFPAAVRHYERAVTEKPRSAEAHNDLGNAYRCAWRLDDAAASYRRAVEIDPKLAAARHNLGVTLLATGDVTEAIHALENALELRPDHADTLVSLAEAYGRASRHDDLAPVVSRLQTLSGADGRPTVEKALGFHHLGQGAKAIATFREVLASDPSSFDALRLMGLLLIEEGQYEEALEAFERALVLRPDSAEVGFYRSIELLRAGDFIGGFAQYEVRWQHADFTSPRREPGVAEWDGGPDPTLTLLLHTEQGIGDTLQFIRFAAAARERVGRIVLECEGDLVQLLAACDGIDEIVAKGQPLPAVDAHLPLLSLPHRLNVTLASLPSDVGYVRVEGGSRLPRDPRLSVGIVWAGSSTHANDANRSCSPADFQDLIVGTDARFVSLQKDPPPSAEAAEATSHIATFDDVLDLGGSLGDWSDTARIVRDLDLVITVDTAVAHLAGAMGKDVWVLLPFDADWRWLAGRDDSPWYPTMRLFRQTAPGDWADVFRRVRDDLAQPGTSNSTPMSQPARAVSDLDQAVATFREAVAVHCRQDLEGAERLYREAIRIHPGIPEAHNNLGAVLGDTHRKGEALQAFATAVELNPEYGEALNNLGMLRCRRGETTQAIESLERAVRTAPERVDWVNNLGNAYLEQVRVEEAMALYDQAISLDPSFVFARNNRAVALRGLGRYDESIAELEALIVNDPGYFEAINNLGLALRDSGRRDQAVRAFQRALALSPDAIDARVNLGLTYQEMGRHDEARHVAAGILQLDPHSNDAYDIYGHCAYEEGDYDLAYDHFGRAIELQPEDVNARWNRALLDLHRGRLREGFAGYEWRKKLVAFARNRRPIATPEWDGSQLGWQSVLVISEQGLGDALQFVRYAAALKDAGAGAVHVECDPALADLLLTAPGVDSVVPRGQSLPEHDVHAYMLSLPGHLGTDIDNLPGNAPYLAAPSRDAAAAVTVEGLSVGFVWAGSPGHSRDHIRSASLDLFERLFSVPDTNFYSLQKGGPEAALADVRRSNVHDLSALLADFGDTAAVVEKLDLVVTVDTSVAHLAGALGKSTWLLLPHVCDFRWMAEGETSPWYPAMRIFRQPSPGDWESVFEQVHAELEHLAGPPSSGERPVSATAGDRSPTPERPLTDLTDESGAASSNGYDSGAAREGGMRTEARADVDPIDLNCPSAPDDDDLQDVLLGLLQDGDTFIDVDPASGGLVLAAVDAPVQLAKVVAVAAPEPAMLLRDTLVSSGTGSIEIQEGSYPEDRAHLVGVQILRSTRTVVTWGTQSHILESSAGRSTLVDGRLAGVIWHMQGVDAEQIAAVLSRAGFDHFRIERDAEGVLLEADSAFTTARTIVSLRRSRLEEFQDQPETSSIPSLGVRNTNPSDADIQAGTAALADADGGAPVTEGPVAAPTARIGIDWPIGGMSGWQVYGTNLATHLATRDGTEPWLAFLADRQQLPPIARFALLETLERSNQPTLGEGIVALRALGNRIKASSVPCWPSAQRNVGVIFFEDTLLLADAIGRGRSYDAIVAGSTWNADVLRANGLDNVLLSLQGIDPTLFHPAPPSGLFGDRFVVFSGGKLEYRKGQDIVVAAFREFQKRHPEALLLFAWHNHWPQIMEEITYGGHVRTVPSVDGTGAIDFAGWLLEHGLPDGAFLDLGVVPNAQMGQLLREAHVGLFPNRGEGGTNLVAMELMACGIPAVLSANTGHLDLLGDSGAYPLIDQGTVAQSRHCPGSEGWGESSVEEIVDVLEGIYTNRAEAADNAARSAAFMKRLSWANQVEHLMTTLSPLF